MSKILIIIGVILFFHGVYAVFFGQSECIGESQYPEGPMYPALPPEEKDRCIDWNMNYGIISGILGFLVGPYLMVHHYNWKSKK